MTQASVCATFTHPVAMTTVKLQLNHKRLTPTRTTHFGFVAYARLKNPTMFIEIAVYSVEQQSVAMRRCR